MIMALLEVRHLKKHIQTGLEQNQVGGVEGCDLFRWKKRVYGSDGESGSGKDDTSEPGVV